MKKLKNPYTHLEGYNCFGCCPRNSFGLKMVFFEDGDEIISHWCPSKQHQGWIDILHGGIQAALIDEIASWVLFLKCETTGVTSDMNIKYRKSVNVSDGQIELKARLINYSHKLAQIHVELLDGKGNLCTEGKVRYFAFDKEKAQKQYGFHGKESFYENDPNENL